MVPNLQVILKNIQTWTSMYNIRLVANSVLLSTANDQYTVHDVKSENPHSNLHISAHFKQNPQVGRLRLPTNIDPVEMTKSREINAGAILEHQSWYGFPTRFDVTIDSLQNDQSYRYSRAVCSMQSNVNKFTHLDMLGGQWQQGNTFLTSDLIASYYVSLRKSTRSDWASYEKNVFNGNRGITQAVHNNLKVNNMFVMNNGAPTKACVATPSNGRSYSTGSCDKKEDVKSNVSSNSSGSGKENREVKLSRKEMLKKAMKDYGSTVIIFYVGISLISLGSFYLLVSSGLDVVAILQHFGWGDSQLCNKIAAGASTFVVAYAIHMVFASVRISLTLAATPFIVRYLRNKGFLKKPSGSK